MTISFIVCSNGYGHLKRVIFVVNELVTKSHDLEIHLFLSRDLLKVAKTEVNFHTINTLTFHTTESEFEPSWIKSGGINAERYELWLNALYENPVLRNSDLIVSDNHISPLLRFPHAWLMGNFYWPEVSDLDSLEKREIAESELNKFGQLNPVVICVEDVAMPFVKSSKNLAAFPWFCRRFNDNQDKKLQSVLFTGGGTELVNDVLAKYCAAICELGNFICYVDKKLYQQLKNRDIDITEFSFADEDFASLDVVVCRPGVGILTDCVRYTITPIVINDNFNKEISHNADVVRRLGIGREIDLKESTESTQIELLKMYLNDSIFLKSSKKVIGTLKTDGAAEVANFILKKGRV